MSELGLANAISQLRKEISQAMEAARNDPLQFALGPIEVELQLQLSDSAGGNVGLKWVVVSVGGEAKTTTTTSHRIKFTLTPEGRDGKVLVRDAQKHEPE